MNTSTSADNWRELPAQTVPRAAELLCCSSAQIYALYRRGELELRRIAGRTTVSTKGLVRLIDNAPQWTPSATRGVAARARRAELTAERQKAEAGLFERERAEKYHAAMERRVARRRQLRGHKGGSDGEA